MDAGPFMVTVRWMQRSLVSLLFVLACVAPALAEKKLPVLNQHVLHAVRSMPKGLGYDASPAAVDRLAASVQYDFKRQRIAQDTRAAKASFCSGATYLVFLRVIESLRSQKALKLSPTLLERYANLGVKDGEEIFGRWNANGPGTAKLFAELGCGTNFTSFDRALPGDFMKIWWTSEIGAKERGHSVVFLGQFQRNGVAMVRYWSANKPRGYGEDSVPRSTIKRVLFSRLERHERLRDAARLTPKNRFLADMLRHRFTWSDVVAQCRVQTH